MRATDGVRRVRVSRSEYWFGQRVVPLDSGPTGTIPGLTTQSYQLGPVHEVFGGPVYGLAIGSDSEVRGVRIGHGPSGGPVRSGDDGWLEVVEGAPLHVEIEPDAPLFLERLDAHDGALVLVAAMTPEARAALPLDVSPVSVVALDNERLNGGSGADGGAIVNVYLAPPRAAAGYDRAAGAYLYHVGTGQDVTPLRVHRDPFGDPTDEVLSATALVNGAWTEVAATALKGLQHAAFRFAYSQSARHTGRLAMF